MTREEFVTYYSKKIYRFPYFRKGLLTIKLSDNTVQDVRGVEFKGLFLHKTPYASRSYTVSHLSGFRVLGPYKTRRDAKAAMIRLATVVDSSKDISILKPFESLIARLQADPFFLP